MTFANGTTFMHTRVTTTNISQNRRAHKMMMMMMMLMKKYTKEGRLLEIAVDA
jgi:hypothetical protein